MYYKLLQADKIIDIVDEPVFIRIHKGMQFLSDINKATGVASSDSKKAYHIAGTTDAEYYDEEVYMVQIDETEAQALKEALGSGYDVQDEEAGVVMTPPEDEQDAIEHYVDESIDSIKQWKINSLSKECVGLIEKGFDCEWGDGRVEHYSLSIHDQVNLLVLKNDVENGALTVIYHPDGEEYRTYTENEFLFVYNCYRKFKDQLVYQFSCLRSWIESMTDPHDVMAVKFTDDVPDEFMSEQLKALISNVG